MLTPLKQQLQTWLFRPKIESGAVTLTQRRIFILPTRKGAGFALLLLLTLLGDINYNLSLGYALTFLLGSMAMLTMVHAGPVCSFPILPGRIDSSALFCYFLINDRNERREDIEQGGLPYSVRSNESNAIARHNQVCKPINKCLTSH